MRKQTLALLASGAALILAAGFGSRLVTAPPAPASPTQDATPARLRPSLEALAATPQADAYRERQRFKRDVRGFLAGAGDLGAVQRSERAEALAAGVDDRASAGELSAGEAFLLQAALIRAATTDEEAQTERLARLAERYRADAARREAAWAARLSRDPRFQDYKAREEAIVAEVMAMSAIPDGLSRDEYLRRRLQAAREAAYR